MNRADLISKEISSLLFSWYEEILKVEGQKEAKRRLSELTLKYATEIKGTEIAKSIVEKEISSLKKSYDLEENENTKYKMYKKIEKLQEALLSLEEVDSIE